MTLTTYRITRQGAPKLLFLLHGWSAEQHHLAAYVPLVDPAERYSAVCPRAPHDLPEGDGASWYDRSGTRIDEVSFSAAVELVGSLVRAEADTAGIDFIDCVLGGFSQGGFVALALAGRPGAPRYGGVWAMCSGLPNVGELDFSAGAGARALIQVGERDQIIDPARGRACAAALADAGWDVRFEDYDMGHTQTIEMMIDARAWLAAI